MDDKDTFCSFDYKGYTIHTCHNRSTGAEEVQVQCGKNLRHMKTLAGAKRFITKCVKLKSVW